MTDKTRGIFLVLGLLAVTLTAFGCGGGGGNASNQFTGTWQYTQSSATLTCPGQADVTISYGTTKLWDSGVTSDLVDMTPSFIDGFTQCFYGFDIKDKSATIQSNQQCQFTDSTGAAALEKPTTWTFTLTSATTADEKFTAAFDVCSEIGMATLKRVATSN